MRKTAQEKERGRQTQRGRESLKREIRERRERNKEHIMVERSELFTFWQGVEAIYDKALTHEEVYYNYSLLSSGVDLI